MNLSISGELQLPLNSVDLAGPVEEWKDLAPVDDGSNQYLGDLCLSLRYVPSSGKLTGEQQADTKGRCPSEHAAQILKITKFRPAN